MTSAEFRELALALPEAAEGEHMGHPDFRVRKKVFATLGPDEVWGMVKLTPEQQAAAIEESPQVFEPFNGAWGRGGATKVHLEGAEQVSVGARLVLAWRNTAPKTLVQEFDE